MRRTLIALMAGCLLVASVGLAVAVERLALPEPDGEVLTLLLLGSDGGPPRQDDPLSARADGVQLLFVSADRQHASFVSIPRDAWVSVPGRGNSRINACLNAGPERCVETAEQEFGLQIDGYLVTSMRGFANAVEEFGRLVVDVPTPVFDGGQNIPDAGEQRLSGSQSLTYARDRKNRPDGDFGRSAAQAELLMIGHRTLIEDVSVRRVLDAAATVRRHTTTDLGNTQLVRLAFEALHVPPDNVQRELAPARHGRVGAASVVFLDDAAYAIIADAAEDGRIGTS